MPEPIEPTEPAAEVPPAQPTAGEQLTADYAAAIVRARADLAAAGKPSGRAAAIRLARHRMVMGAPGEAGRPA